MAGPSRPRSMAIGDSNDGGPSSSRRPSGKPKRRNLVLTVDGTSNQFGTNNTNVVELYSRLAATEDQLNYYNSGIGTFAQPSSWWQTFKQKADNSVDLAIAWNFENLIKGAYRWLSERYKPGDRIYLFGFSRGAYQIRVLAGMIEKVGLIQEGNEEQIPFAFELYKSKSKGNEEIAARFKETFSMPNVRVHFVGVWDTVSSVGVVGNKVLPLTDKWEHINIFRHALALDERRVKFIPECIMRAPVLGKDGRPVSLSNKKYNVGTVNRKVLIERVKEVWFAGSHSDVGGGNLPNDRLNLESAPLLWMVNEAAIAGLLLTQSTVEWKIRDLEKTRPHRSLRNFWWILEYIPVHRQSRSNPNGTSHWRVHHGKGRAIYPGQKIHASVAFKNRKYTPTAVFRGRPDPAPEWEELIGRGPTGAFRRADGWQGLLEMDLFDLDAAPINRAIDLLASGHLPSTNTLHILNRLGFLSSLEGGAASILALTNVKPTLEKLLNPAKPGLVFLATVKLLARLAAGATNEVPAGKPEADAPLVREVTSIAVAVREAQAGAAHASWAKQAVVDPKILKTITDMLQNDADVLQDATLLDTDTLEDADMTEGFVIIDDIHADENETDVLKDVEILKHKNIENHRGAAAASTVVELASLDDARKGLHECIPALVRMLGNNDASASANALMALAQYGNARKMIYEAVIDAHPTINDMLKVTNSHRGSAAVVIADLAEYLCKGHGVKAGLGDVINGRTILLLVKMLADVDNNCDSTGDADANRSYAADAIAKLSHYATPRKFIVRDNNTIPHLIKLLRVKNHGGSAANALAALVGTESRGVHDVRKSILDGSRTSNTTKTISVLVDMLEDSWYGPAATVLSEFVSDSDAAHSILTSKAPLSLMDILNKSDKQDRVPAALCIAAILRTHLAQLDMYDANYPAPAFSEVVIDHQGILNLVKMLKEQCSCRAAADAIAAFAAYDSKQRKLILENPHVIEKLVDMLQGDQFASAAVALAQLAVEDNNTANEKFLALDVVPTLETILRRLAEAVLAPRQLETDAKNTMKPEDSEAEDADHDKDSGVKLKAYYFDKVAGAAAILFKLGGFRLTFKSLDDLVKVFVKHLGAESQDGVWNAIKELARHMDSKQYVADSEVVAVSVYLSREGDRSQRIFAKKCLIELAELGIGPRSEQYMGRAMINFCRRLAGTGR